MRTHGMKKHHDDDMSEYSHGMKKHHDDDMSEYYDSSDDDDTTQQEGDPSFWVLFKEDIKDAISTFKSIDIGDIDITQEETRDEAPPAPMPRRKKAHYSSYYLEHAIKLNNEGVKLAVDENCDHLAMEKFEKGIKEFEILIRNDIQSNNNQESSSSSVASASSTSTRSKYHRLQFKYRKESDPFLFNKLVSFVRRSPHDHYNFDDRHLHFSALLLNAGIVSHRQATECAGNHKTNILVSKAEKFYERAITTISTVVPGYHGGVAAAAASQHSNKIGVAMMVKLAAINNFSQALSERAQIYIEESVSGFTELQRLVTNTPRPPNPFPSSNLTRNKNGKETTDTSATAKSSPQTLLDAEDWKGMIANCRKKGVTFAEI